MEKSRSQIGEWDSGDDIIDLVLDVWWFEENGVKEKIGYRNDAFEPQWVT